MGKIIKIICAGFFAIILVIIIISFFSAIDRKTDQERIGKIYEQIITDNADIVIAEIPLYNSVRRNVCPYRDGFLVEDSYGAEWYIIGNVIYAVNGLAKSLTPKVEYAPEEIAYSPCY